MKEHEDMLNAIKPKDEIITGGGIYAKVVKADDAVLTVEIANGVEIKISRSSVREVVSETKENSEKNNLTERTNNVQIIITKNRYDFGDMFAWHIFCRSELRQRS